MYHQGPEVFLRVYHHRLFITGLPKEHLRATVVHQGCLESSTEVTYEADDTVGVPVVGTGVAVVGPLATRDTKERVMSYTSHYRKENEQARRLRKAAGAWLKGLRQDAGLTQAELSKKVGYEYYTFVSQVECGSARVPSTDLERWASALEADPQEFAKELLGFYDPHWYKMLFPDG